MDDSMTMGQAAPELQPPPGGGVRRWLLDPFLGRQTWLDILYLLLSFPIGLAAFCVLVTMLAMGGGLAVTLVGVPILVAAMYIWCEAADIDRAFTNILIGTRIPPLPFEDTMGDRLWRWPTVRQRLANPYTWRSLAYLLLRFPQGVTAFTVAVAAIATPLSAIALPFTYRYSDGVYYAPGREVDTLPEALVAAALGLVLLVIAVHVLRGLARLSGAWATAMLGGGRAVEVAAWAPDTRERDAFEVLAWRGLRLTGALDPHAARLQSAQVRAFGWHLLIAGTVAAGLALINAMAQRGPWSVWPIWGLSIPLAIHAGYLLRGWIGAHVALFADVNLGLFVVDLNYTESTWSHWPLVAWAPVLAVCIAGAWKLRRTDRSRPGTRRAEVGGGVHVGDPDFGDSSLGSGVRVDIEMRRVTVDGRPIDLTPKEFELLVLLYENPGRPYSRGELLDRVWRNEYEVADRTVDACVMRLRRKLDGHSDAIQTVWGVGYRYNA